MLEVKKIDFSTLHSDRKAWKTIWGAGQAVGQTRTIQTTQEIVDELVRDYGASLDGNLSALAGWPQRTETLAGH